MEWICLYLPVPLPTTERREDKITCAPKFFTDHARALKSLKCTLTTCYGFFTTCMKGLWSEDRIRLGSFPVISVLGFCEATGFSMRMVCSVYWTFCSFQKRVTYNFSSLWKG